MHAISYFIVDSRTEIYMHLVVLEGCHLNQKAVWVATGHSMLLKEYFRVLEWNNFVVNAVKNHQERVDLIYMVENAEAVVIKSRIS